MKNYFFVLTFSLLSLASQAQVFSVGPKFGVSQGDVRVSNGFQGDDSKMGYHLGAYARINLPVIYLQPEILYTNTGGSFSDNTFNYDVSFDRLDIPLMVGIRMGSVFRIQAGPVASHLLNSNVQSDPAQATLAPKAEDFTFGFQAGIGFDIGNFLMDLKYEGGVTRSVASISQLQTDQRQNQLILSLGFRLF
ncbi:hypothetical protein ADIS_1744 [Lunatimonas lonarensis]|uniref:Outer membrane protein beta-barrel domain-containing protein n=1 Tax=Lunatimonas lonarensis TaxID=1232681 RepID=R7ZUJ6_9BACT|nr:outer membrane beta-barrel protein [Lunatimonas lonarensis]EON77825.1 hypothetical protein ADIS_1744 [Lunatimonas lonarensis]